MPETRGPDGPGPGAEYPEGWVPVEHRWFGIERRTILPALAVLVFALALGQLLPLLDRAVPYDDEVRAGDVVGLGSAVTFVPSPGWNIESGVRVGEEAAGGSTTNIARVTDDVVSYSVKVGEFDGTAVQLVDQLEETTRALGGATGPHVVGDTATTVTADGVAGAAARFQGTESDGVLVAFVRDGVGVEIVVVGPPDLDGNTDLAEDVAAMIASTRFEEDPA